MADSFQELQASMLSLLFRFGDLHSHLYDGYPGVTRAEAHAVHSLYLLDTLGMEAPARPGEVACKLKVSPSAFSQMMKSLEGKGLIERQRSAEDFRAVCVLLTEEGRQLGASIDHVLEEKLNQVVDMVGRERFVETMQLFELSLDLLESNMRNNAGQNSPAEAPSPALASAEERR